MVYGSVHFLNKILDEGRLQEVMTTRFICADLYCHLSFRFHPKGFIDLYKAICDKEKFEDLVREIQ